MLDTYGRKYVNPIIENNQEALAIKSEITV